MVGTAEVESVSCHTHAQTVKDAPVITEPCACEIVACPVAPSSHSAPPLTPLVRSVPDAC